MSSELQPTPPSDDVAIAVAGLTKEFRFYKRPSARFRELLTLKRRAYHKVVRALDDVSFIVQHGESVGVMGRNGAGKTSLLSVLTGTLAPTAGTVDVYGRVGAILALGVGFQSQYTGRENLRNGLIARGVPQEQLDEMEAAVIEFSELEDAIDNPLRTYSSGMNVRLGFSLATAINPDILIVDEALSVGDAAFQTKCQTAIRQFMEQGKTLFFVSHSMAMLEAVCQRGIMLDEGCVICDGPIKDATRQYRLRYFQSPDEPVDSPPPETRAWGDPDVELVQVAVLDTRQIKPNLFEVKQGEVARLSITVRSPKPVEQPGLGAIVRTALGQEVCGATSINSPEPFPSFPAGEFTFEVWIPFRVLQGLYEIEIGIADVAQQPPRLVHIWEKACTIRVSSVGHVIRGGVDPGIEFVYDSKRYRLGAVDNQPSDELGGGNA